MSLGLVWEKAKWIDVQRALLSLFEKERGAKTKKRGGAKERERQAEQESLRKKAQKREPARHESVGAKKHKNKGRLKISGSGASHSVDPYGMVREEHEKKNKL